jgi:hypothetical protein
VRSVKRFLSIKAFSVAALAAVALVLAVPTLNPAHSQAVARGFAGGNAGAAHGHSGFVGHGAVPGHGFVGHPGFDRHPGFVRHGRGVFVGPGFYWWPGYPYVETPPAYWYYCQSARSYYPYIESCPEPWVPVPAG